MDIKIFSRTDIRETLLKIGIVRSIKFQHKGVLPSAFIKKMAEIDSCNPNDIKQLRWTLKLLGERMLESGKPQGNWIPLNNPDLIFIPEEQRNFIGNALMAIGNGVDANIAFGFKTGHKPKKDRIEENRIAMLVMWCYYIADYKPIERATRIISKRKDINLSAERVKAIYYKHKAQLEVDLIEIGLDTLKIVAKRTKHSEFKGCCYEGFYAQNLWHDRNEIWNIVAKPPYLYSNDSPNLQKQ